MAAQQSGGDDDELITAINVTPLVDIVLVLLIIMMVTASWIASKQIPAEVPSAATGQNANNDERTLAISIDREGRFYLDAELRTEEQLIAEFQRAHAANPNVKAAISADTNVSYGTFVRIVDLLRRSEITRYALNVRPEALAPGAPGASRPATPPPAAPAP